MRVTRKLRLAASIILCYLLQTQGADNYTDVNRPYEFGFKIDGEQHRHEKKDKDGIIMGEFGFITADDVYHVTVYATDKEGRFKILSMKNIHLKSSPVPNSASSPIARQGHALALPPAQSSSVSQPGTPISSVSLEPPRRSCSSCSLPTSTTKAPPPSLFSGISSTGQQNNAHGGLGGGAEPKYPESQLSYTQQGLAPPPSPATQTYAQQPQNYPAGPSLPGIQTYTQLPQNYPAALTPPGAQTYANQPQNNPGVLTPIGTQTGAQQPQNYPASLNNGQVPSTPNNYAQPGVSSPYGQNQRAGPKAGSPDTYQEKQNSLTGGASGPYSGPGQQAGSFGQANPQQSYSQDGAVGRTAKQYNGPEQLFGSTGSVKGPQGSGAAPGQGGTAKPTLVSAQMQIVDKNTDVHALYPGEKTGLPPGLTTDDMTQLLYTFNYTLGFQGHFEEGYTNGVKKGYYYVTARNGVRTRIDYTADDTGFHPKVSQDILDLLSDDVPKPETEKDEKFGLKGYEFKWLYYPVDSKRHSDFVALAFKLSWKLIRTSVVALTSTLTLKLAFIVPSPSQPDEDGIIKSEFGFIDDDDEYHVTVYATSEKGRFNILSMKNIQIKSTPALNSTSPESTRQGHALTFPTIPADFLQALAATPRPFLPGESLSSVSFEAPGQQNNVQNELSGHAYEPQGGKSNYNGEQQSYPQHSLAESMPDANQTYGYQPYESPKNYSVPFSSALVLSVPNNYVQPGVTLKVENSEGVADQPASSPQIYTVKQNSLADGKRNPYLGSESSGTTESVSQTSSFGRSDPSNVQSVPHSGQSLYKKGRNATLQNYTGTEQQFETTASHYSIQDPEAKKSYPQQKVVTLAPTSSQNYAQQTGKSSQNYSDSPSSAQVIDAFNNNTQIEVTSSVGQYLDRLKQLAGSSPTYSEKKNSIPGGENVLYPKPKPSGSIISASLPQIATSGQDTPTVQLVLQSFNSQGETSSKTSKQEQNYERTASHNSFQGPEGQQNYPLQKLVALAPVGSQTNILKPNQSSQNYSESTHTEVAGVISSVGQNLESAKIPADSSQIYSEKLNSSPSNETVSYPKPIFNDVTGLTTQANEFKQANLQQGIPNVHPAKHSEHTLHSQGRSEDRTSKQYNGTEYQLSHNSLQGTAQINHPLQKLLTTVPAVLQSFSQKPNQSSQNTSGLPSDAQVLTMSYNYEKTEVTSSVGQNLKKTEQTAGSCQTNSDEPSILRGGESGSYHKPETNRLTISAAVPQAAIFGSHEESVSKSPGQSLYSPGETSGKTLKQEQQLGVTARRNSQQGPEGEQNYPQQNLLKPAPNVYQSNAQIPKQSSQNKSGFSSNAQIPDTSNNYSQAGLTSSVEQNLQSTEQPLDSSQTYSDKPSSLRSGESGPYPKPETNGLTVSTSVPQPTTFEQGSPQKSVPMVQTLGQNLYLQNETSSKTSKQEQQLRTPARQNSYQGPEGQKSYPQQTLLTPAPNVSQSHAQKPKQSSQNNSGVPSNAQIPNTSNNYAQAGVSYSVKQNLQSTEQPLDSAQTYSDKPSSLRSGESGPYPKPETNGLTVPTSVPQLTTFEQGSPKKSVPMVQTLGQNLYLQNETRSKTLKQEQQLLTPTRQNSYQGPEGQKSYPQQTLLTPTPNVSQSYAHKPKQSSQNKSGVPSNAQIPNTSNNYAQAGVTSSVKQNLQSTEQPLDSAQTYSDKPSSSRNGESGPYPKPETNGLTVSTSVPQLTTFEQGSPQKSVPMVQTLGQNLYSQTETSSKTSKQELHLETPARQNNFQGPTGQKSYPQQTLLTPAPNVSQSHAQKPKQSSQNNSGVPSNAQIPNTSNNYAQVGVTFSVKQNLQSTEQSLDSTQTYSAKPSSSRSGESGPYPKPETNGLIVSTSVPQLTTFKQNSLKKSVPMVQTLGQNLYLQNETSSKTSKQEQQLRTPARQNSYQGPEGQKSYPQKALLTPTPNFSQSYTQNPKQLSQNKSGLPSNAPIPNTFNNYAQAGVTSSVKQSLQSTEQPLDSAQTYSDKPSSSRSGESGPYPKHETNGLTVSTSVPQLTTFERGSPQKSVPMIQTLGQNLYSQNETSSKTSKQEQKLGSSARQNSYQRPEGEQNYSQRKLLTPVTNVSQSYAQKPKQSLQYKSGLPSNDQILNTYNNYAQAAFTSFKTEQPTGSSQTNSDELGSLRGSVSGPNSKPETNHLTVSTSVPLAATFGLGSSQESIPKVKSPGQTLYSQGVLSSNISKQEQQFVATARQNSHQGPEGQQNYSQQKVVAPYLAGMQSYDKQPNQSPQNYLEPRSHTQIINSTINYTQAGVTFSLGQNKGSEKATYSIEASPDEINTVTDDGNRDYPKSKASGHNGSSSVPQAVTFRKDTPGKAQSTKPKLQSTGQSLYLQGETKNKTVKQQPGTNPDRPQNFESQPNYLQQKLLSPTLSVLQTNAEQPKQSLQKYSQSANYTKVLNTFNNSAIAVRTSAVEKKLEEADQPASSSQTHSEEGNSLLAGKISPYHEAELNSPIDSVHIQEVNTLGQSNSEQVVPKGQSPGQVLYLQDGTNRKTLKQGKKLEITNSRYSLQGPGGQPNYSQQNFVVPTSAESQIYTQEPNHSVENYSGLQNHNLLFDTLKNYQEADITPSVAQIKVANDQSGSSSHSDGGNSIPGNTSGPYLNSERDHHTDSDYAPQFDSFDQVAPKAVDNLGHVSKAGITEQSFYAQSETNGKKQTTANEYPRRQQNYTLEKQVVLAPSGLETYAQPANQFSQNNSIVPSHTKVLSALAYPQEVVTSSVGQNLGRAEKLRESSTYELGYSQQGKPNIQSPGQSFYSQGATRDTSTNQYTSPSHQLGVTKSNNSQNIPAEQKNYAHPNLMVSAVTGSHFYSRQPDLSPQNYSNSANNVQLLNAPKNSTPQADTYSIEQILDRAAQRAISPRTQSENQKSLFGGKEGPYHEAGASDPTSSTSQTGYIQRNSQQDISNIQSSGLSSYLQGGTGSRMSKQYTGSEQQLKPTASDSSLQSPGYTPGRRGSTKPMLVSVQIQIVSKDTDVHALLPGEKAGLPAGLQKEDMTQILYTFNYTVGFNSHFEEGYKNGVKKGYYYVTSRNGVRTRIDYTADDTGFHPKVSQEVLELLSENVPKPETETDAKFGLKNYEFKWLYYPDSS